MFSSLWLRPLVRRLLGCPPTRKPATPRRARRAHLVVEALEDRVTPSVTVTTTMDPTTPITGQLSLREAINMVNAGQVADNTIILPTGTYQNAQGALNITHSLILQGASASNTIIDGGGTDRVVLIDPTTAVNVQISGVTIQNGKTQDFGGGIDVVDVQGQASVLTLNNCIVTGNEAEQGGGINNFNGDVTLNTSQILNNKADTGEGGGVSLEKGGTDNLTVSNSTISGNSAADGGGGLALLDNGGAGTLTITGSTIDNNTVTTNTVDGGGIVVNSTGAVSISTTTFSGNSAELDGGAFESTFDAPSSITFSNDTLTGNSSTQGNGGGIANHEAAPVTIEGCSFTNDAANGNGGGISETGTGALNVDSSSFAGDTAASGGGIEDDSTAMLTVTNSTFDKNQAKGNLTDTGSGGGIDTLVHANINNDTFTGNHSSINGGAVFESGGGTTQLLSCLFLNNTASANGGAVGGMMNDLVIFDSQFTGNTATDSGGAVFSADLAIGITNSTFNKNQTSGRGGAVFINTTDTLNINDSGSSLENDTFTGNSAVGDGGAITSAGVGDLQLFHVTINGNSSGGDGGGIAYLGAQQVYFVENSLIAQNTAAGMGPDVFTTNPLTITDEGGNFIGTLTGSAGFLAGTLTGNPLLGPLQNNGGRVAGASANQQIVQTEALLPGSPTIDKGSTANGMVTDDERGFTRPIGGGPDIGAFEFQQVALQVTVTPTTPSVNVKGTEGFTIIVKNTSGNALPADNSMLSITLSAGLTTNSPMTFTLPALAAGQSQTFTVSTTATTSGTQMLTASVTSPDANPNSVSGNASVSVLAPLPTTHTPLGTLTLFAFGFGPTGIDLFEVDSAGDIFAVLFVGGGAPLFLNTTLQLPIAVIADGQLLALLAGSNGQGSLIDIINPFNPFIEPAVITALTHH